jgi:hypothetical protein
VSTARYPHDTGVGQIGGKELDVLITDETDELDLEHAQPQHTIAGDVSDTAQVTGLAE